MALGAATFWIITLAVFAVLFLLGRVAKWPLWLRVILALIAGGACGYFFPESAPAIQPIGQAFVNLIRMLVVPLIFTTLVAGVISMGDPKRLGSLGLKTLSFYICTTVFAVTIGILFGILLQPGVGVDYGQASTSAVDTLTSRIEGGAPSLVDRLLAIIPTNPVAAMVSADVLGIIFFAILFGVGILMAGEQGKRVGEVMESAADAILKMTVFIMELAPYGVFALMAWVLGEQGLGVLVNLGKLAIALYAACLVQIVFVYGGIIRILLGLPFVRFISGILDAMATAYSTASSSATLPVTISNVSNNLGVKKSVAGSVLPLGATINMDGTSIYLGLVALFAAQALGIELELIDYVMIALTATMASIGAAGIPSASLFLAITVLTVFNVPEEQAILVIAFIFPFDRLLDMMRTLTNVTGDAAVATVVAKWEDALDEDVFRGKTKQ
ncbi:dicarboxylate/amino acid:cation symporter [Aquisalinus flavus]|uniref:Dicarboxylate:amino acid:cation symporter DAACS family protein n=1 Tax=Aquisalinus flavus TaxID=1526572 RepID=A0A8J2V3C1_9PROT|nr:dicarboxylate/amino acid:cation symporter [Aquisalinus flavus]MBD0425655.1 dicarboxylate/amino acid:cation symporter [Aquisalinus flavus]UNE48730.1 dicarboxylate/amino acid:cation symporter [Aquisalinus flavus]GGD14288.1 dicarboxylate:amino acid:cation symporter DAACS family protein [Aquisalinus flavus]